MPRITVSYRRDDSGAITGRIFDRLTAHYGRDAVFRDIDSIPPGADFREHINEVLDLSDIVIAVVGPRWIGTKSGQNRLENAGDPVRVEIETALRKKVPLIPVLVMRASMPIPTQLPDALQDFAYRNAVQVDSGQDFDVHIARLIKALDRILLDRTGGAVPMQKPLAGWLPAPPAIAGEAAVRSSQWFGALKIAAVSVLLGGGTAIAIDRLGSSPAAAPAAGTLIAAKQAAEGKAEALQGQLADAQAKSAALQQQLDDQAARMRQAQAQLAEMNGRLKTLASAPVAMVQKPPTPAPPAAAEPGLTAEQIRQAQQALRVFGGLRGEPSGVLDAATQAAIKQFQAYLVLPQSGVLSATEYRRLLDMNTRLTTLLQRPPVSPAGTAAASLTGGAQRYAKAWAEETGKGGRTDAADAAYWYALAAADGERQALTNLGLMLAAGTGTTAPDADGAVLLWRAAAAGGEAIAMYNLGAAYEHGIGVGADPTAARQWYERAAAQNNAQARAALQRLGS